MGVADVLRSVLVGSVDCVQRLGRQGGAMGVAFLAVGRSLTRLLGKSGHCQRGNRLQRSSKQPTAVRLPRKTGVVWLYPDLRAPFECLPL